MKHETIISGTSFLAMFFMISAFMQSFGQSQDRAMPGRNTKSDYTDISCPIYLVTIEVKLGQQDGATELGKENFTLYDNGVRQDFGFWTRIEPSVTENKEAIYAIGFHPPVYAFDGNLHRIKIVVRNKANKKLSVQFFPARYRATKEFFDGPQRPPNKALQLTAR